MDLTTGETEYYSGRRIAIDGVHNVISFLEKLENEENPGIHFFWSYVLVMRGVCRWRAC